MKRRVLLLTFTGCVLATLTPLAQWTAAPPRRIPGLDKDGTTLLPNGWRIAPAGRHHQIGDLPLSMRPSPDGRFLVVANNGWEKPTLTVFDTKSEEVVGRADVSNGWLGLVWAPDGQRLYSSGAADNAVYPFDWHNGRLTPADPIVLGPREQHKGDALVHAGFIGGLAISPDGARLFAVQVYGQAVSVVDLAKRQIVASKDLPAEPYTCLLSKDGRTLFVSLWGGAKVLMFDAQTLDEIAEVPVGEHPNAMTLDASGARLFVACANTNAVWVIDVASRTAKEQISVSLYPDAPVGSTPNSLALSPDGKTLLVADADNNTVAVADVSTPWQSRVKGWVPVGWYPTGVLFDRDGSRFFVLDGKGLLSAPNVRGPQPGGLRVDGQYTGNMFKGALSVVPTPTEAMLARMTAKVRALTPYTEAGRLAPPDAPVASPIPQRVGGASPIRYVFYVIRENRTYDQELGDVAAGNGDPRLTLFGEDVTPNGHAIASQFALFDNFYVDAEVSYDGHAFSTGAYATDFVEKMWPINYARRGGLYLSEGGYRLRNAFGNIAAPPQGYIWDFATRAGLTVRSYGEFASWKTKGGEVTATVPGLEGKVSPEYPPFDLSIPDQQRADVWTAEFTKFEQSGDLPRLSIIRLGNDHTSGTSPGLPTPRADIADNDLALGRIVETITHSRFWKESAIFVLEDDAQNGPDHVDAHRSILYVISPFVRRHAVDSTLYTTSGVLRTMELILGLPPMSQYDASATPLYNAFQPTPDTAAFTHLPARVPLDEKNDWQSPGAAASLRMNLREADLAPELELNQIIWQSVRGAGAVMPPPKRSGFVHPLAGDDDDR
ncbi:MAG TPA: bifunctional YncE family protein/alkaline phosphatase family protein [Vicinamibacterales bacterium]|nr:bifunctional YncE family protein/alkaline phosphatase family protein [Vicinamibacterales bacterium]